MDGDNGLALIPSQAKGTVATISAQHGDAALEVERFDLAKAQKRQAFIDLLCKDRPGIARADVQEKLLSIAADLARERPEPADDDAQPDAEALLAKMPDDVVAAARAMLESENLLECIGGDFPAVGIAGERSLAGTIYLTGVSRLLAKPLALLIQGPSSSGKSYVAKNVVRLFPPEAVVVATSMSAQALFYAKPGTFRHRFVFCGERSRKTDDDQAEVTRALREMLSEGRLSRLVTQKDKGGGLVAELVEQEGPISYIESTTLATGNIFAEDLNRMLLLATDETPQQTKRVLSSLATKYQGGTAGDAERVIQKHHAMQRLLRPHPVAIPYAERLVDALPSTRLEIRRGAGYILAAVEASAVLHQYQRQQDGDGRLYATLDDFRVARALLAEPLGRLLGHRVSDGALRFLGRLVEWFGIGGTYTVPEAKVKEQGSPSAVYLWNSDLASAGLVEIAERKQGNRAARYRVTVGPDAAQDAACILPEPEEIGNG